MNIEQRSYVKWARPYLKKEECGRYDKKESY